MIKFNVKSVKLIQVQYKMLNESKIDTLNAKFKIVKTGDNLS